MSDRRFVLALAMVPVIGWLAQVFVGLTGCGPQATIWGGVLAVIAVTAGTTAIIAYGNGDGSLNFLTVVALHLGVLFSAGAILAWITISQAAC